MNTLRGANPRKIVFFDGKPTAKFNSPQGAFLDPWGTPYRIDLSNPEEPRVWSCGPNRRDEGGAKGSDDIVSWRWNWAANFVLLLELVMHFGAILIPRAEGPTNGLAQRAGNADPRTRRN